ncbi:MAG: hypothetical protein ABIK95_03510 [Acidobacteriota bacterium]
MTFITLNCIPANFMNPTIQNTPTASGIIAMRAWFFEIKPEKQKNNYDGQKGGIAAVPADDFDQGVKNWSHTSGLLAAALKVRYKPVKKFSVCPAVTGGNDRYKESVAVFVGVPIPDGVRQILFGNGFSGGHSNNGGAESWGKILLERLEMFWSFKVGYRSVSLIDDLMSRR